MSDQAAVTEAIIAPPQEVGFKAFVGNLAFATKDQDLRDIFEKLGPIKDAQVIHRGARSLGYGFVTFATEADAQKAISSLDKTEISGRQINVELAKPPTNSKEGRVPKEAAKAAKKKELNPVKEEEKKEVSSGEAAAAAVEGAEGAPKKKKSNKKRAKGRRPRADAETEEAGDAPVAAETKADGEAKPKRAPRTAAPRAKRGPPTGEPSKTLLFVANLPFSVNDESLRTLFGEYKVATARVVTKKFGPGSGRSKGFGFVDFENEEEQKKAFEKEQGKEVEGREIQLKIAVNPDEKDEEKPAEAEKKEAANGDSTEPEAVIVAS